jgi:hypothetical protein
MPRNDVNNEDEKAQEAFRAAQDRFIKQKRQAQRQIQTVPEKVEKPVQMQEEETITNMDDLKPVEIEDRDDYESNQDYSFTKSDETKERKTGRTDVLIWIVLILVLIVGAIGIISKFL